MSVFKDTIIEQLECFESDLEREIRLIRNGTIQYESYRELFEYIETMFENNFDNIDIDIDITEREV